MKVAFFASAASWHTLRWMKALKSRVDLHLFAFDSNALLNNTDCTMIAPKVPNKFKYIFGQNDFRTHLQKYQPDILHSHYATGYGYLGMRMNSHPFVVSVWGSDIFEWPAKSPMHKYLLKTILKKADAICATSQKLYEGTTALFPEFENKIQIIPFGIDTKLFQPAKQTQKSNEIVIGIAKLFDKIYQLDLLMKVVDELLEDYETIRLKIAGDGPERERLVNLRNTLKFKDNIEILPSIPNDILPKFLNSLDIFAIPSKFESYGVAALEASACGLPVVGFNVGGLAEIVHHNESGYLVEGSNREDFKKALSDLINDKNLRQRMGARGRALVLDKGDMNSSADMLIDLYQKL